MPTAGMTSTAAAVLLADTIAAAAFARDSGAPSLMELRTMSPAMLAADPAAIAVDRALGAGDVARLNAVMGAALGEIRLLLAASGTEHALIVALARRFVLLQRTIWRAMCVTPDLFERPVVVAEVDLADAGDDQRFNAPWPELLAGHADMRVIRVPAERAPPVVRAWEAKADLWTRLRFEDARSIAHRVLMRVGPPGPRGTVLVSTENTLVKETVVALCARGFGARKLPRPAAPSTGAKLPGPWPALQPSIAAMLGRLVSPASVDALLRIFEEETAACATSYAAWRERWRATLAGLARARPRVLIANADLSPRSEALFAEAEAAGLLVVGVQHGVTPEIAAGPEHIDCTLDSSSSHLTLSFSEAMAVVHRRNRFRRGRPAVVGMPRDILRAGRWRRPRAGAAAILYASNYTPMGNVQLPFACGVPDRENAALPHRVLFKPYMTQRYLDPDPVYDRVRRIASLEYFAELVDLRYLLPDCRVVVASRATSTISWCLLSGKPFVFFDLPDQLPLRAECRADFEAALFFFDAARPDWIDEMRAFLSQPLDRIDALWTERAAARSRLVERWFGIADGRAGARAAAAIVDALRASAS